MRMCECCERSAARSPTTCKSPWPKYAFNYIIRSYCSLGMFRPARVMTPTLPRQGRAFLAVICYVQMEAQRLAKSQNAICCFVQSLPGARSLLIVSMSALRNNITMTNLSTCTLQLVHDAMTVSHRKPTTD